MKLKTNILKNIFKKSIIYFLILLISLSNYRCHSVILKREDEASGGSRWVFWTYGPNGERQCAKLCIFSTIFLSLSLITCGSCIWFGYNKTKSTNRGGNGSESIFIQTATRTPALIGEQYGAAEKFTRDNPPQEDLPPRENIEEIQRFGGARAWKWIPGKDLEQKVTLDNEGEVIKFLEYTDASIQTNYPCFVPVIEGVGVDVERGGQIKYSEELFEQPPNLPHRPLHYYEMTILENLDPTSTTIVIGLATKPYPYFRLPGPHLYSVGYYSINGNKYKDDSVGLDCGPDWGEVNDTVGCGYYSDSGDVFFTKNGDFIETAFTGIKHIWFPTVGANGSCIVDINFGDDPSKEFRYKEANGYGPGGPLLISKRRSLLKKRTSIRHATL